MAKRRKKVTYYIVTCVKLCRRAFVRPKKRRKR